MGRMLLLILAFCCLSSFASAEWDEKVLYSFQGGGTDGSLPAGGVIFDKAGNLYGETIEGGSTACPPGWCGTIYQLSPPTQKGGAWTETVLYVFKGHNQNDGSSPSGSLIADTAGNLYGVTGYGGSGPCVLFGTATGCGTVFELSPPKTKGGKWTETVLYNFQGGNDGDLPTGPLVLDSSGNLYGATEFGGGKGTTCDVFYGGNCGTVFKMSPPKTKGGKWTEKVLHRFAGGTDGAAPNGGLVLDSNGTVYGTTYLGGYHQGQCDRGSGYEGCGVVFALRPPVVKGGSWSERVLYRFKGSPGDGLGPNGSIVFDTEDAIYGTTSGGGSQEDGIVFKVTPPTVKGGSWTESLLHTFTGGNDGSSGLSGLLRAVDGSLYGSAGGGAFHRGVVFRMTPSKNLHPWIFDVLYSFTGSPDGYDPLELTLGKNGAIFGATLYGGTGQCQGGCGAVFESSPLE
ncbi:MAG: choice-of-anchor tandem repeat GloVer-containing protein [Terriglobales bacterium]